MKNVRKIFRLLSKEDLGQLKIVILFSVILAVLDLIGISLVLPTIGFIVTFEEVISSGRASIIYKYIGSPSREACIGITIASLIIFYVVKNYFSYITLKKQYYFAFEVRSKLSSRLYQRFLNLPYEDFKLINISSILNVIANEVNVVTGAILLPLVLAISDFLVITLIFILLCYLYPIETTSIMMIFTLASLCILYPNRKRLPKLGKSRQIHETRRINIARESFNAFRELRTLNVLEFFTLAFKESADKSAQAVFRINLTSAIPRLFIELVLVLSISIFLYTALLRKLNFIELSTMLVVFVMAGVRLMPAFTRITGTIQNIRSALPALEILLEVDQSAQLTSPETKDHTNLAFNNNLELKMVSYIYPGRDKTSLEDINLKIEKGCSYGIHGKSGSGKTTLIEIIVGLLRPSSGKIFVDGCEADLSKSDWFKNICLVPQQPALIDDSIAKNIALGVSNIDENKLNYSIDMSGLREFVDSLKDGFDTQVGDFGALLSGGQKQRISIARALYYDHEIIIFDEPTSSQDAETEANMIKSIKELVGKKTIIIISHNLENLSFCDEKIQISDGRLILDE